MFESAAPLIAESSGKLGLPHQVWSRPALQKALTRASLPSGTRNHIHHFILGRVNDPRRSEYSEFHLHPFPHVCAMILVIFVCFQLLSSEPRRLPLFKPRCSTVVTFLTLCTINLSPRPGHYMSLGPNYISPVKGPERGQLHHLYEAWPSLT